MQKENYNKNAFMTLFVVILIALLFFVEKQFHEKLQANAFMQYDVGYFRTFSFNDVNYKLPEAWDYDIVFEEVDYHRAVFKDKQDNITGSIEVLKDGVHLDEIIERDSEGFIRSELVLNELKYILLSNKVIFKDNLTIRNFNYYTAQGDDVIKLCFSFNDKISKENIRILFESIVCEIKFV